MAISEGGIEEKDKYAVSNRREKKTGLLSLDFHRI